jgi:cytochrome c biogenesis protein CcdA
VALALGSTFLGSVTSGSDDFKHIAVMIVLVISGLAIYAITRAVQRDYRCPACEEVPMGGSLGVGAGGFSFDRDVLIRPSVCPSCGARLK